MVLTISSVEISSLLQPMKSLAPKSALAPHIRVFQEIAKLEIAFLSMMEKLPLKSLK